MVALVASEDFRSYRTVLSLKNLVSGTEVDAGGVVVGDKYVPVSDEFSPPEILELGEGTLLLVLPGGVCSLGHRLEIDVCVERPGTGAVRASLRGVVAGVEKVSPGQARILVRVSDAMDPGWIALHQVYQARQDQIDQFLQAARGF